MTSASKLSWERSPSKLSGVTAREEERDEGSKAPTSQRCSKRQPRVAAMSCAP